jgi:hypothetical protein
VKRWESSGRDEERRRIWKTPESRIWGNASRKMGVGEEGDKSRQPKDAGCFVWGYKVGEKHHVPLQPFRTVLGTVWGLGLNPGGRSTWPRLRGRHCRGRVGLTVDDVLVWVRLDLPVSLSQPSPPLRGT